MASDRCVREAGRNLQSVSEEGTARLRRGTFAHGRDRCQEQRRQASAYGNHSGARAVPWIAERKDRSKGGRGAGDPGRREHPILNYWAGALPGKFGWGASPFIPRLVALYAAPKPATGGVSLGLRTSRRSPRPTFSFGERRARNRPDLSRTRSFRSWPASLATRRLVPFRFRIFDLLPSIV
jgi:hypothetical protein